MNTDMSKPYSYQRLQGVMAMRERYNKSGPHTQKELDTYLVTKVVEESRQFGGGNADVHNLITSYVTYSILFMPDSEEIAKVPDEAILGDVANKLKDFVPMTSSLVNRLLNGLAVSRWVRAGKKIYEVSGGLTQRLMATRLTGVSGDVLRLPYQSIVIRPAPNLGLDFDELVITEQEAYDVDGQTDLVSQKTHWDVGDVTQKIRKNNRMPRSWRVHTAKADAVTQGAFINSFTVVRFFDGDDLETSLKQAHFDEWSEVNKQAFQFAMNTVLYMTWPDTGEEFLERNDARWEELNRRMRQLNGYKRERAKAAMKTTIRDHRIYLGAKVPFMETPEEKSTSGQKLMVRTLVSGHWKMQPYGPGRSERKLIRIEPFWRGPLDGPVSNPTRLVG